MRCIICDMSGVASVNGEVNKELLEFFNKEKNIELIFATGKGINGAKLVTDMCQRNFVLICENGGLIEKNSKIIQNYKMPNDLVEETIECLVNQDVDFISFNSKDYRKYIFINKSGGKLIENIHYPKYIFKSYDELKHNYKYKNVVRIVCKSSQKIVVPENLKRKLNIVKAEGFYNFTSKNVCKSKAVEYILAKKKIEKKDCIVIGNDQNDICLFQQPFGMKIAVGEMCDNELLALSNRQVLLNDLVFLLKECMK